MQTLADSLALHATGEGSWRAFADPRNEANTGMFGGWTAALLMKSVLSDARAQGEPSAITISYVNRVSPGRELNVRASPIGGGRSVMTWRAEVLRESDDALLASASVLITNRRDTDGFTEWKTPSAPIPEELPMVHPPATFGQHVDMRMNKAPFGNSDSHSVQWIRERTGHAVDHVLLAYLADCYPPRILYRGSAPRPSSTLTMSVYFYASAEELAAVGDDFMLSEAVGTRAEQSIVGSQLRLWSRSGALLTTSEQLCWFK
ncbi:MAG TPA: thioesterase family protein [Candidatus Binatia bacterium]|nr:thioesterase family protein [Candidatus Binatia bacterium]